MIGWGMGTLCPVILVSATNALLLRFMTDVVGIAAGLAAALFAASKLYDAFSDPAVGILSDRSKFAAGRRRPFILVGGFLMAIAMILLFWVPDGLSTQGRVVYMGAALLFYATAYSIFNVPYMAMPAEMIGNYDQRSELMTYRVFGVGLSQVLATALGPYLIVRFGGGQSGHLAMAIALAPMILLSGLICFYATKSAPFTTRPLHTKHRLKDQFRLAFANKPYLILISAKLLTLSALGAQAVFPFFFTRILELSDLYLGQYFLCFSLALVLSQPFWYRLSVRIGKKKTFLLALGIAIPLWLSWLLAGRDDPLALVLLRGALIGFSSGGTLLMGQALLPDTMEYDYLTTGLRREGIFAGVYTTVEKLASAIGITVVGALLSAAGYIESRGGIVVQPAEALTAIRYITGFFPAFVCAASFLILLSYDLSEEKIKALRETSPHT